MRTKEDHFKILGFPMVIIIDLIIWMDCSKALVLLDVLDAVVVLILAMVLSNI
jgi:hypothetical protein